MPPLLGRSSLWPVFAVLLAGILASITSVVRADEADSPWLVRVWKTTEGLAGSNIGQIIQTDDGFLWTLAGGELERFDGVSFTHVPVDSFAGGPPRKIRDFTPLHDGGLALATFDGAIVRIHAGQVDVSPSILPHSPMRLEALSEDPDGTLLAVFNDESVWRVRGNQATPVTAADGLPSGAHCRFTTDTAGQLWFAKGSRIGVKRGARFEILRTFPEGTVRVAAAKDGGVWIGAGARLLRYTKDGSLKKIATIPLKNISVRPTILLEDRTGALWFGTYSSGLFRFDGSQLESVPISHRQAVSLIEDREGSMWVGTSGGGLNQVQPRAMTLEGDETGVPFQAVQAISEDASGHLWAVTQNGLLARRQDGAWKIADDIPIDGAVRCVAVEPGGAVWIGAATGRIYRWNGGQLTTWGHDEGVPEQGPSIFNLSSNGDLWIASSRPGVLQRLRAGKLETFDLPRDVAIIRAIVEDVAGDVWVAATGKVLARISQGRVIDESEGIASVTQGVQTMKATPDGSIWFGFAQGGIGRLKGRSFGRVTTKEGLPNDNVLFIFPDYRGWMWIAAGESLFKVSLPELNSVIEGRSTHVQPVRYGREQGVKPVFGASIGALLRSDGKLWIPMATSLAIIDPSLERSLTEPPPVWITEVRVDDRVVAAHGGIFPLGRISRTDNARLSLPPEHRRIDLNYTALSFRTPSNVQFRYRLENFDDGWIDAGTRRTASYSRLSAGDYRFRVQACSSDGVWNETGATLALRIQPYFTETWWFRATSLLAFAAVVTGVTRTISVRRLRQRLREAEHETALERERARIARDIHDDLGGRLTKIVLLSGLANRDVAAPEKMAERVAEISETAQQLVKSLDETVWTVNPRNDTLPHLVSYIGQFAVKFLRTAEIVCDLEVPDDPPALPVSAELRHHLLLAIKEALTNVVRHSGATRVVFGVTLTETELELRLEDNGRGFTVQPTNPDADGLRNLQQRMNQIGGRFDLRSEPGRGTRVSLILPRPPSSG